MTGDKQVINTGSDQFSIVVSSYGNAKGTKSEFQKSDPTAIDPLVDENYKTYTFATQRMATELQSIRSNLTACWQGDNANNATDIIDTLDGDAQTIGTNALACNKAFQDFQTSWVSLRSQADGLYEGVAGSGIHQDNSGAHKIYKAFNDSMQGAMHAMPSKLTYSTPLDGQTPGPGGPGGPGPGPGGPGNFGPGPGGPGNFGPGPGPGGHFGPGPGPGPGPGFGPGPGPGPGPGFGPGPGYGPGGYGPGSGGGPTGSTLASYDGGGMGGGAGGGLGAGGGPGAGAGGGLGGADSGLAGGGVGAGGAGSGGGGAGPGGAGTGAAGGRGAMMPMHGSGQNDDGERERSTWLSEDESVWGAEEAPPGLIT